jgi:hypothetical protein
MIRGCRLDQVLTLYSHFLHREQEPPIPHFSLLLSCCFPKDHFHYIFASYPNSSLPECKLCWFCSLYLHFWPIWDDRNTSPHPDFICCNGVSHMNISWTFFFFCPGWPWITLWTEILPISASQVARLTGLSHQAQLFFYKILEFSVLKTVWMCTCDYRTNYQSVSSIIILFVIK